MDYSPPGSYVHGDSPGKNTEVGSHSLLQGIFPTQGLNLCLLLGRQIPYHWATCETLPNITRHQEMQIKRTMRYCLCNCLLCPPLSPRVCSNSCPLSHWCYLTISSSATSFSFCLPFFPALGSFPMFGYLCQMAKVLEHQLKHQSFQ